MRAALIPYIVLAVSLIACKGDDDPSGTAGENGRHIGSESGRPQDTELIDQWTIYFESSDEGLWEDNADRIVVYELSGNLYELDDLNVPIYSPFAIRCHSDTIFISDAGAKQIVAMDDGGSVLWKAGDEGEGPGHFSMVTTLAVSDDYIAALNMHLRRIELFNRDGSFSHSLEIVRPQDIVAVDDTTFVVASTEQPGGDFHIVDADRGVIRSFGEANIEEYENIFRPDLVRLCLNDNGRLAAFNRYEGLLAIYDIETEEPIYIGSREYPVTPTPPRPITDEDGQERTMSFPIGGNAYLGLKGMLNVVVCNYMEDGSFISDPDYLDFAPVTCIDRYDWNGNYLDSYCLPDSCINFVAALPDGRLVGRNFAEGVIKVFDVK